jgi:ATP-dependent protease ClpP protease subunit
MNKNEVFISGVIGNSYNPDGSIKEKGVELVDVVEQVADLGEVDEITFVINSPGGNVSVGLDIKDFIASIPNAKTYAGEMCASIATVIHTAVPLQNRSKEQGGKYMIHNPWVELSGDAATLASVAKDMDEIEKNLEGHYSKATGASKETISAFMASEMWLTDDQCIKLKFASEVIPKASLRAVAIFQTSKNDNMSTENRSKLAVAMATIKSKFGIGEPEPNANATRTAKAVMIETESGTIETPFSDLAEGDPLMVDGTVVEGSGVYVIVSGDYVTLDGQALKEGDSINYTDGLISGFEIAGPAGDAENLAALQAKLEASEAKNAELETANAQLSTENNAAAEQLEALAKMGSNFVAPAAQARMRNTGPTPNRVTKEGINAILGKRK